MARAPGSAAVAEFARRAGHRLGSRASSLGAGRGGRSLRPLVATTAWLRPSPVAQTRLHPRDRRGCRELEPESQLRAAERWASASARAPAGRAAALSAGTYLVERAREWVSLCEQGGEGLGESGETDPGKMW